MDIYKVTNRVIVVFSCLLLTSCGVSSGKWLVFGFDLKTELGIRSDPIETFTRCLQQQKEMSAGELSTFLQKETVGLQKDGGSGDWGKMVCLAFHQSATSLQVKTVLSLIPKENRSAREELIIGLLKPLLEQRVKNATHLEQIENQLKNNFDTIDTLQEQIEKLQEIEGLLEKK